MGSYQTKKSKLFLLTRRRASYLAVSLACPRGQGQASKLSQREKSNYANPLWVLQAGSNPGIHVGGSPGALFPFPLEGSGSYEEGPEKQQMQIFVRTTTPGPQDTLVTYSGLSICNVHNI